MDRIDAISAFITTVDEGSLAGAARRLNRSPAAITRAIAELERRIGTRLLYRTTRVVRLTEAGARYVESCRQLLADLEAAELFASGEQLTPRGLLTITAPLVFGRLYVRPLADAFMATYSAVQVRLLLFDRVANLVEEGIDLAVRIGHLPDSGLMAVKVGEVRRVVCASPNYLARRGEPREPSELTAHDCISFSAITPTDLWTFTSGSKSNSLKRVRVKPRLTVTQAEAAIDSAVEGHGVTCVLSYQIEHELQTHRLKVLLGAYEPAPQPVHVVYPEVRMLAAKVRLFGELAVPKLKAGLTGISRNVEAGSHQTLPRSPKRSKKP
jgi:DNA-binding transcriptional LysR family regulator